MVSLFASAAVVLAGISAPQGRDSAAVDTIRALAVTTGGRPSWVAADSIYDLRQREPRQGAPASEHTVVRVAQDGTTLFVNSQKLRKQSLDNRWHVCFGSGEYPAVLCIFEPPSS